MRYVMLLSALPLVAGCASGGILPTTGPAAATASAVDTCGAAAFAPIVGTPIGDAAALREAGVVFRVAYPDDDPPATTDPARIIVRADAVGTVQAVECG